MISYIPGNDSNWILKGETIYYSHYLNIPILTIIDGVVFVYVDLKIRKKVLKMIKHLIRLGVDFYFLDPAIWEKRIYNEDLSNIIGSYFRVLSDEIFFDGIFSLGFDFSGNILRFMFTFDCFHLFEDEFKKIKKYLNPRKDWSTGKEFYIIEREDIRDYISSLNREITLNILLG